MRTLVNAVIAYFARSNTVHAHTRTRVKLIQSHTRSFAETQMHADAINSLNYLNWGKCSYNSYHTYTCDHLQTHANMRTLVNAVIAYFARSNTVHAHTRTRVKLIQSHTRSFAETQMHADAINSLNYLNWGKCSYNSYHTYTCDHLQTHANMRTLVNAVIAYFARSNTVHAHTRKTDPVAHAIICRNTDARMQTHTQTDAHTDDADDADADERIRTTHTDHAYERRIRTTQTQTNAYGPRIRTTHTNENKLS